MYANGQLGEPDYSKAIELYKQAANNEYGLAMLRLGRTYENGWYDTEINLEEALKWYQLQTKIMTGHRNVWTVLNRLFRMLLKTADRKTPPIYSLYASP